MTSLHRSAAAVRERPKNDREAAGSGGGKEGVMGHTPGISTQAKKKRNPENTNKGHEQVKEAQIRALS